MRSSRGKLALAVKHLGLPPFECDMTAKRFRECENSFRDSVKNINSLISKFNILVPFMEKQLIPFDLDKEVSRVLQRYKEYETYVPDTFQTRFETSDSSRYYESREELTWRVIWRNIKQSVTEMRQKDKLY